MKTAKAHRKFAIYSIYLDTWLEGEEEVREGESRKDVLKRILAELEETAAELRKETLPNLDMAWSKKELQTSWKDEIPGPLPTISLNKERLEIQIDNCTSLEELAEYKELASKSGLVSVYMQRLSQLTKNICMY